MVWALDKEISSRKSGPAYNPTLLIHKSAIRFSCDLGPGEQIVGAYTMLDASLTIQAFPWLSITAKGANLLNQEYLSSADDKAVFAPGRAISLGMRFQF